MPRKIQAFIKPERILTSYDFIDIARGRAVVDFYGGRISGANYALSTYACTNLKFWSDIIYTHNTEAMPGIDKDFDIEFNFPKIVEGEIVCNVPIGRLDGANPKETFANIEVFHVDTAGTEVSMGENQTEIYAFAAPVGAGLAMRMSTVKITVPKTRFNKGQILRFNVKVYGPAAGPAANVVLGHDPKNRTFGALGDTVAVEAPSQLTFQVPFKIFI